MRVELGQARGVKTKNAKLALIRKATTAAANKHGVGGRPKTVGGVKPVTLPRLKFMEGGD